MFPKYDFYKCRILGCTYISNCILFILDDGDDDKSGIACAPAAHVANSNNQTPYSPLPGATATKDSNTITKMSKGS